MSTDHTHKTLAQAVTGRHDGHSSQNTHETGVHTETHGAHPVGAHGVHTETHGAHGLTGAHTTGVSSHMPGSTEHSTSTVHTSSTTTHSTGHTDHSGHLTGHTDHSGHSTGHINHSGATVTVEKIVNAPVVIEHHHEHVKTVIHPSIERQHETVEVRQVIQPVHEKVAGGSHEEYAGKHVKVVEKVESAHAAEQQIAANHAKLAAQAQVTTSKSESVVVDATKEKDVAAHHKVIEQVTPVIYRDVEHEKVVHKDEKIIEKIAHAPEVHVVNQTHTTTHVEGGDHTHKHVTVDHDHKHATGDHSHGHKHGDHGHAHSHDHKHGDHSHGHTHGHDHKHADHKH